MVATVPSASPRSWRPLSRALCALFAGSAMMFTAAVVQGGSLVETADEVAPAAEPVVEDSGARPSPATAPVNGARTAIPAALAPGQAGPWTPGASPDWRISVGELPARRAPVRETPQPHIAVAPAAAESSSHPGSWRYDSVSGGEHTPAAEQSDGSVIDGVLSYLSTRMDGE